MYCVTSIKLGSQFKEIRTLLDWTQEDSAEKIGVSRNSIVNIEKNPANMKKHIAYAFYMEIYKELNERDELSEKINNKQISINNDKKNLKDILLKVGLSSSIIAMPSIIPVAILSLGSMDKTSKLLNLFNYNKKDKEIDEIDINNIIDLINKSTEKIKSEIANKLEIDHIYNTIEFINNIYEG